MAELDLGRDRKKMSGWKGDTLRREAGGAPIDNCKFLCIPTLGRDQRFEVALGCSQFSNSDRFETGGQIHTSWPDGDDVAEQHLVWSARAYAIG